MEAEIQQAIQRFLREEILEDSGVEASPDMPLLSGFLDSFGLVSLINFLEETYDITVSNSDVTSENFRSIEVLAGFADAKRRARG